MVVVYVSVCVCTHAYEVRARVAVLIPAEQSRFVWVLKNDIL